MESLSIHGPKRSGRPGPFPPAVFLAGVKSRAFPHSPASYIYAPRPPRRTSSPLTSRGLLQHICGAPSIAKNNATGHINVFDAHRLLSWANQHCRSPQRDCLRGATPRIRKTHSLRSPRPIVQLLFFHAIAGKGRS